MGQHATNNISPDQARELLAAGEASALDLRDDEERAEGHIPGAVHIAPEEVEQRLDELPEGRRIIVVGERSEEVAATLRERDRDAASLDGGMEAWTGGTQPAGGPEFFGPGDKPPGT